MSSSFVISAIKKAFPECILAHLRLIRQQWRDRTAQKELECVRQILSRSGKNLPQTKKESEIQSLLEEFSPLPAYGYDDASLWLRACERTSEILKIPGMNVPGKTVLELGCGDGLTGWMLSLFGHRTILCDQEDWRNDRARSLPFLCGDICDSRTLAELNGPVDLVYSYNSMEHFSDPKKVFDNIVPVINPEGHIYLKFGPLYASPLGLHAYRTLWIPYIQYLFPLEAIEQEIQRRGLYDLGVNTNKLQQVNGWLCQQYEDLWNYEGLKILRIDRRKQFNGLDVIKRFPDCFAGRGLTLEDVTTLLYEVLLQKKGKDHV